jgi:hypothetical protein
MIMKNKIILSPHFDDACFSCFSILKPKDLIINIFTKSKSAKNINYKNKSIKTISKLRKNEDSSFIKENQLHRINLNYSDYGIFSSPFINNDYTIYINPKLEKEILDILKISYKKYNILLAPLGIGKHIDHLQVFSIIQKNYNILKKTYEIIFYEDIPYISYNNYRYERLKIINHWLSKNNFQRTLNELTKTLLTQKIKNLNYYSSQFDKKYNSKSINFYIKLNNKYYESYWKKK